MTDGLLHEGHEGDVMFSAFNNKMSLKTLYRLPISLDDFMSGRFNVQIPKGWFNVSVIGGNLVNMKYRGDTLLLIPPGNQCDSVCAFSRECYAGTDDDEYIVKGPLNKQFCTVRILVKDIRGNDLKASMNLSGRFDGFNVLTLEPHRGEFRFDVPDPLSGVFTARIPRQSDTSLEMEIEIDGKFMDSLPLGILMNDLGYNWGTMSLDDITVVLEYDRISMSVSVSDWEIKKIMI